MELVGDGGQPRPTLVAVGPDQPDRAGDVGTQVGDHLRWQRTVGDVHPSAGPRGQAPGDVGSVDYQQDVHGDTPIMPGSETAAATGRRFPGSVPSPASVTA